MAFAIEAKAKGDEDKIAQGLRQLQEEDPTIDLHRDEQTGEQIVAGLTQIHVEVVIDRLKERFSVEVELKPPRVPYLETIRKAAKAHGRHKKQTGGRGQFADCHIEIEPIEGGEGFEFVNAIKGGVIPGSFIPAVEKGVREAMAARRGRRLPGQGRPRAALRRQVPPGRLLGDGVQDRRLDGDAKALEEAGPVLLEPIMLVTLAVPEEAVGDVIGDLNSRRGRPLGMEPGGRHDRDQGRGADVGDAHLRARPARDHRRPGRLHDGVPALRGGSRPPRPEGGRRGARGGRGGQGLNARLSSGNRARAHAAEGGPTATLGRLVTRKSISTNTPVVNCDVCGRTLLPGEAPNVFLAAGEKRNVCELCTQRASP